MADTKFDIKAEATRPFYATVGVTDLAVEVARQYVTDVQAKVARIRRSLPEDIQEPIIQHFDPNDAPIMSIAFTRFDPTACHSR